MTDPLLATLRRFTSSRHSVEPHDRLDIFSHEALSPHRALITGGQPHARSGAPALPPKGEYQEKSTLALNDDDGFWRNFGSRFGPVIFREITARRPVHARHHSTGISIRVAFPFRCYVENSRRPGRRALRSSAQRPHHESECVEPVHEPAGAHLLALSLARRLR